MPSIATQTKRLQEAIEAGALQPSVAESVKPPIPVADYPVSINAYSRGPLPASSVQQPDMQRGWQTGATPQVRLIPTASLSNPVVGAQAQSQAITQISNTPVASSGGVTSVGLKMPSIFVAPIPGSPVTSAGVLDASAFTTEPFNTFFAGPADTQGSVTPDTVAFNSVSASANPIVSVTVPVSGNVTQANDLALFLAYVDYQVSGGSVINPSGYTVQQAVDLSGGFQGGIFSQVISTTGPTSPSISYTSPNIGGLIKATVGAGLVILKSNGGTPSVRQKAFSNTNITAGGSVTVNPASTLAGSTILVVVMGAMGTGSTPTVSVTDSQLNTYTTLGTLVYSTLTGTPGTKSAFQVFAAPSSQAAALVVTISNSSSSSVGSNLGLFVLEIPNGALPIFTPIFRGIQAADLSGVGFTNGVLQPSKGGTGANLAATGGVNLFLSQASVGAPITVVQPDFSNLAGATKISKYNNINTVSNGVPAEYATVDRTAQSAAIAATTIYTPTATGMFRVSAYLKVTTVDATSSTLGAVTLTYTDGTDSTAQTVVMQMANEAGASVTTNTGNTTAAKLMGSAIIFAAANAIQYAVAYASNVAGTMQYELHLKLESL